MPDRMISMTSAHPGRAFVLYRLADTSSDRSATICQPSRTACARITANCSSIDLLSPPVPFPTRDTRA